MAKPVEAYAKYTPRVKLGKRTKYKAALKFMTGRGGINSGTITETISLIQQAIVHFGQLGMPVKIEGLGTWTPTINRTGKLGVAYRADNELLDEMNDGGFQADIENREMIGKPKEAQLERWNAEHPDDPVQTD